MSGSTLGGGRGKLVAAWLAAWLALGPGCGGDASGGRLARGAAARAYRADGAAVPVFFASKTEQVPAGTRVKVLADSEGDAAEGGRRVVVAIQEGAFRGMAGQMDRADLRGGD